MTTHNAAVPTPSPSRPRLNTLSIPPAFFDVARVAGDDIGVLDFADVVVDVAELHFQKPSISGLCGSPSSSVNAWCLRCTATHSLVHPGRQPERELEHPLDRRMQNQRFVRRVRCRKIVVLKTAT